MILDAHGRNAPELKPIALDKLKRFIEFEQLLRQEGWTLACIKCRNAIKGDNDPQGSRLSVSCQCKELVFDAGGN